MACKCQRCGTPYKVGFLVPHPIWELIKPAGKPPGAGLLCGPCITKAIESFDEFDVFVIDKPHRRSLAKAGIKQALVNAAEEVERLKAQRDTWRGIAQDAYALGTQQATDTDRIFKALGVFGEQHTIEDALAVIQHLQKRSTGHE